MKHLPPNGSRTDTFWMYLRIEILGRDRPRGCASDAARGVDLLAEEEPTRDITGQSM